MLSYCVFCSGFIFQAVLSDDKLFQVEELEVPQALLSVDADPRDADPRVLHEEESELVPNVLQDVSSAAPRVRHDEESVLFVLHPLSDSVNLASQELSVAGLVDQADVESTAGCVVLHALSFPANLGGEVG
jgi:hypothetical protein